MSPLSPNTSDKQAPTGTDIAKAAYWLTQGGVVAIPTETVYGLAANALDVAAVGRVFEAKNRPHFDPLIVHVASLEQASAFVLEIPQVMLRLAEVFWPGPLTLLLPKRPVIPGLVTAGSDLVGIRVPAHPMTWALLDLLTFPLAAPSANPFGYVSPTRAEHVARQLGDRIDYILDGGPCQVGLESTIVEWTGEALAVHRLGGVTLEQLSVAGGGIDVVRARPVIDQVKGPVLPGTLASHYAPKVPLVLMKDLSSALEVLQHDPHAQLLWYGPAVPEFSIERQALLSEGQDLNQAAGRLFDLMQRLDRQAGISRIIAVELPEEGLGRAINDRLRRAAGPSADGPSSGSVGRE